MNSDHLFGKYNVTPVLDRLAGFRSEPSDN